MARRGFAFAGRTVSELAALVIDAKECARLERKMADLGRALRDRVIRRSIATVLRRMRTQTVRDIVEGTDMRPSAVRSKVRAMVVTDAALITVRSSFIPLIDLGSARQFGGKRKRNGKGHFVAAGKQRGGVTVRGWGRHAGAFIATMGGHRGIFTRKGEGRLPVKELWGPNPAAYVLKHDGEFLQMLTSVAQHELVPEIERQIDLALRGV